MSKSHKIVAWFMEQEIWFRGVLQPPTRNNIILIGDTPNFDLSEHDDEEFIHVLSEDNNWYTIQKKEIHLIDAEGQ